MTVSFKFRRWSHDWVRDQRDPNHLGRPKEQIGGGVKTNRRDIVSPISGEWRWYHWGGPVEGSIWKSGKTWYWYGVPLVLTEFFGFGVSLGTTRTDVIWRFNDPVPGPLLFHLRSWPPWILDRRISEFTSHLDIKGNKREVQLKLIDFVGSGSYSVYTSV